MQRGKIPAWAVAEYVYNKTQIGNYRVEMGQALRVSVEENQIKRWKGPLK